ncbi:hypothetical protein B0T22DRAFT_22814 [Podospora appendiculata]|uniref:Uncharacterized protein n=1 Tax=Podospora appendiculata TaxID=314037 RepID=A0AAE0XG30_9PEZI|nr:hypothetical protein B0T22DRAFT_22814 [Podospora appendiculata]
MTANIRILLRNSRRLFLINISFSFFFFFFFFCIWPFVSLKRTWITGRRHALRRGATLDKHVTPLYYMTGSFSSFTGLALTSLAFSLAFGGNRFWFCFLPFYIHPFLTFTFTRNWSFGSNIVI